MSANAESVVLINEKGFDLGENLYPYMGCCLCVNSIYPKYPECIGGICEITCCCLAMDVMACKPSPGNPDHCCTMLRAQIDCVKVTVCVKSRSQFMCCDSRAAIPPEATEVPCMVSLPVLVLAALCSTNRAPLLPTHNLCTLSFPPLHPQVSILGLTCCYDNKQSFHCCATMAGLASSAEKK